jgi:hypothetical protein
MNYHLDILYNQWQMIRKSRSFDSQIFKYSEEEEKAAFEIYAKALDETVKLIEEKWRLEELIRWQKANFIIS